MSFITQLESLDWENTKVKLEELLSPEPITKNYFTLSKAIELQITLDEILDILDQNPIISGWHIRAVIEQDNFEFFEILSSRQNLRYKKENALSSPILTSVNHNSFEVIERLVESSTNIESPMIVGLDALDIALQKTLHKAGGLQFAEKLLQYNKTVIWNG